MALPGKDGKEHILRVRKGVAETLGYKLMKMVKLQPVVIGQGPPEFGASQMNTIIYKTIHKYYCSAVNVTGVNLILYGTKSWNFPQQDVNLTLEYPTSNPNVQSDFEDYMITGFRVILYLDGGSSNGFIINGGILENTITLSFTSEQISTLRYQFWVFGTRMESHRKNEAIYRICY
ncbi:uncharacterized protein LOC142983254 [Anticarsia gemmatalis]|uniref:uncharacterized protein LOC142983254 n=1 Tax=Anticarsia gemmatalis TaxID=129554 RepID=UPI003F7702EA